MAESKNEKPVLEASGVTSMFLLKSELYRKMGEQREKESPSMEPRRVRNSVLRLNKSEQKQREELSKQRQKRIGELEKLVAEEEEAKRAKRILEEKCTIYDRLIRDKNAFTGDNDIADEFLVDFDAKRREEEKRRKEETELETKLQSSSSHFVPTEEQRVYGVSHIPLSHDESKRSEQIKELVDLSKKTEVVREKTKQMIEQREKLKLERLNRIRKRKGLEELPTEPVEPTYLDIPLPEKVEQMPPPIKVKKVREWDRGKVTHIDWVSDRRNDRIDEFAPPSSYRR